MLKLFFITNCLEIAQIAENSGVDRIWIDLETLGKCERQKGMNSVKSNHAVADIAAMKPVLKSAELMVRINPWNEQSEEEINDVIQAGADVVMLPMWKTAQEVARFLACVKGRVCTSLLLETKEAVDCVDEVLQLSFDEIHVGLNDLHLSYHQTFMFEPLADGTVEALCRKFQRKGVPYGFGGIAGLGGGLLPAEKVIAEHYRLGSTRAILSRSFFDCTACYDAHDAEEVFSKKMKELRKFEHRCMEATPEEFQRNQREVQLCVESIVSVLKHKDL